MNLSHLWSILFFLTMILTNILNQILQMDSLAKYFMTHIFQNKISFNNCYLIICLIGFIIGIPFITDNGFFLLQWIDLYITMVPICTIIIMEIFTTTKNLKINILKEIIANTTGYVIPGYIFFSVSFIAPILMIIMIVLAFYYHLSNIPNWKIISLLQWAIMLLHFILIIFFIILLKNNDKGIDEHKLHKYKTINVINDALETKNDKKRIEMNNI